MHTTPSGHILTKSELQVLAKVLAIHSNEKVKEIIAAIKEKQGGDILLEEVESSLRESGLTSVADDLKGNLDKGEFSCIRYLRTRFRNRDTIEKKFYVYILCTKHA